MSIKILDCTLRDGGYYNNWDFSEEVIHSYLKAMSESGVDLVELGLRNYPSNSFKGATAFTTESYLNELDLPQGPIYGVMVDAKTIIKSPYEQKNAISRLFCKKENSKLGFVRVASHYHEIEQAIQICKILKNLDYFVGLNLMQSVGKSGESIENAARLASESKSIDVLYFADSLGNMSEEEQCRIVQSIKKQWQGEIGLHAHDNTSRALSNTIKALELGVNYVDSTITGMGRGAGNTKTEILLTEIENKKPQQYVSSALHELVLEYFEPMQREYGWGTSLLYHIGAKKSVHPTYIQQLYSDKRFGARERAQAIKFLGQIESSNYDGENLEKALNIDKVVSNEKNPTGHDISNLFENREILLLGAGDSVEKYKSSILQYISAKKPIVFSININKIIPQEKIDYYAISHNIKYLTDHKEYGSIFKKIIAPLSRFKDIESKNLINYELLIQDTWKITNTAVTAPYELTTAYALAICIAANSKSIKLVGFDGYESFDSRNNDIQETLDYFKKIISIQCLTPTNYNIPTGSIYAI